MSPTTPATVPATTTTTASTSTTKTTKTKTKTKTTTKKTTATQQQARTAAFTLIEVIVSLVLSMLVLAVCTTIMVNTIAEGRRTRAQAELARDGTHLTQLLGQELRQAGLGVPNGAHISSAYGTTANTAFYASLLVAGASQLGFVGDLPRPDATYNAYGPLHSRPTGLLNVNWHTENNGSCVPDLNLTGTSCQTGVTSLFFPGENGCNAIGASKFNDRTCPWGLRRVLAGERIVVVSGDGRWSHAALGTNIQTTLPLLVLAPALSPGFGLWPNPPPPSLPVTAPGQVPGQGWVTTLDRVFYKYDLATRTVQRRQCSGDPDPDNANWPGPTATTIPASPATVPNNTCGPFEIVARNVESLTFSYFNAAGAAVATRNTGSLKLSVRRIGWRIQFRRSLDGRDVIYDVAGSARLQNL